MAAVSHRLKFSAAQYVIQRTFRSDAALEALSRASESKIPNLIFYNYPSFSGAYSALFAHRFHTRLNPLFLIFPFSSIEPFSYTVEDLYVEGLERCYILDFLGPRGFAIDLSQISTWEIIGFDHRKSTRDAIHSREGCPRNFNFCVDTERSSSTSAYKYFCKKLGVAKSSDMEVANLLDPQDRDRIEIMLKYIEDGDLRRWDLPNIKSFNLGLSAWRSKLNCVTNPYMYEQLLELNPVHLIAKGDVHASNCQNAATELLNDKVFKVWLGRGFYGECLEVLYVLVSLSSNDRFSIPEVWIPCLECRPEGIRADGNSNLTDELGKLLCAKSAAAGLRPIGAVVYMQRNNLKMCLRSTDAATDTSEVAKAYGGGGTSGSSSFMIRMDEYNQWLSGNSLS